MKTYNVGPDVPYDLSEDGFVWLVFCYENYGYEGGGDAVALGEDGYLYVKNLSHCSCYGPFDDGFAKVSVEEFLRGKDSVHDMEVRDPVNQKVLELLQGNFQ